MQPKRLTSVPVQQSVINNLIQERIKEIPTMHPWKELPNVQLFRIKELSVFHPILEAAGINKRMYSPTIESEKYRNSRINRYVRIQFDRLNKNRANPAKF